MAAEVPRERHHVRWIAAVLAGLVLVIVSDLVFMHNRLHIHTLKAPPPRILRPDTTTRSEGSSTASAPSPPPSPPPSPSPVTRYWKKLNPMQREQFARQFANTLNLLAKPRDLLRSRVRQPMPTIVPEAKDHDAKLEAIGKHAESPWEPDWKAELPQWQSADERPAAWEALQLQVVEEGVRVGTWPPSLAEAPWLERRLNASEPWVAEQFNIYTGNSDCESMGDIGTRPAQSLQHAAQQCLDERGCTMFTYLLQEGKVRLCQGHKLGLKYNTLSNLRVMGIFKGCEHYAGEQPVANRRNFQFPRCRRHPGPEFMVPCPMGLHWTEVPSSGMLPMPTNHVCDECPQQGVCPEHPNADLPGLDPMNFLTVLQDFTMHHSKVKHPEYVPNLNFEHQAYNPAIFTHNDSAVSVVFRMTNTTRCKAHFSASGWKMDRHSRTFNSFLGFCRLNPDTLRVDNEDCMILNDREIEIPLQKEREHLYLHKDTASFTGLEDPRAFTFKDTIYVTATQGVFVAFNQETTPGFMPKMRSSKIMLIELNSTYGVARGVMVRLQPPEILRRQKNFLSLVSKDGERLMLVVNVLPFQICQLDVESGICQMQNLTESHPDIQAALDAKWDGLGDARQWVKLRGSAGFVLTKWGYLGIVHSVRALEFGRLYSQKWVLLSKHFPHPPVWVSAPFRLPHTGRDQSVEDIQYPAGFVMVGEDKVAVSYGVHDCKSALTVLQLPVEEMARVQQGDIVEQIASMQVVRLLPAETRTAGDAITLKWWSQVTSSTGIAAVTRALAHEALVDGELKLLLKHEYERGPPVDREKHRAVYEHIMQKNPAAVPDVTVRYLWTPTGPNMHGGWNPNTLLVQYLPWEFEAIPSRWVKVINDNMEEVWATSEYVKTHFIRSGVAAAKVFVLPHGVPAEMCSTPAVTSMRKARSEAMKAFVLQRHSGSGHQPFVFLFHGGLLWRKGLDRLLEAYDSYFYGNPDVLLYIHGSYGQRAVKMHLHRELARRKDAKMPRIAVSEETLESESDVMALYDAADVYVHPSRSEGWGLGVAEAMSRGLPPILPDYGAPLDFVSNDTSIMFRAHRVPCTLDPCTVTSDYVFSPDLYVPSKLMWSDFSPADLGRAMLYAFEHREEVKRRGNLAKEHICTNFTWKKAYEKMKARIKFLVNRRRRALKTASSEDTA